MHNFQQIDIVTRSITKFVSYILEQHNLRYTFTKHLNQFLKPFLKPFFRKTNELKRWVHPVLCTRGFPRSLQLGPAAPRVSDPKQGIGSAGRCSPAASSSEDAGGTSGLPTRSRTYGKVRGGPASWRSTRPRQPLAGEKGGRPSSALTLTMAAASERKRRS